ncbi:CHAT domain-containing tetratricopeptide repeat protein [Peristeroidobacter soli]|uniref:CHAT domain-containing tetratricopeptide repeat protein n=1 Tax=Peristeroidobacter soli TaxID=2497877 RepID=UPI00101E10F4|nr:CHAT domain-containing tetratricopeptide repeat protein [Peristeroidobacter soli]
MKGPSCRRVRADWQIAWVYLIGVGLFPWGAQAGAVDSTAQQEARREATELLRRSQNESGRRSIYLPQAHERIQRGLAGSRDEPLQQAQWLEALWEYHLLNDDHAQARRALERSLQLLIGARADASHIDRVTCNLSYSLILLGEVARAKELLRRAIVSATQYNNRPLLAELYYSLGDAYRKTGERLVAQRYFEAAHELDQASGDTLKISISKLKLGSLARDGGDYREAIGRHEQALQVFVDEHDYRELVTYIELARDYATQGELTLARNYAQLALDDPRALPEQRIDASVLLLRLANDQRDQARASKLVRDIETLIHGSSTRQKSELARPTHQLQFAEQAIRYYALNRDLTNVRAQGQAAVRLTRRVASDLRATHDDSLAWMTAAQPMFNEYVKALYELDRTQVLPLLETYYAQQIAPAELRHSGVVGRAYEAEAVELFERYRAAQRMLVDATTELDRLHPDTTDVSRRREAKSRLDQALREWDRARDAYLTMYRAPPVSTAPAATFQPRPVPATDIFIRYFIQENVSFGIALAGNEVRYFDLPPRSTVQTLVRRSLDLLSAPGRAAQAEATLSSLAQLLPRDFIRAHGEATRLVIVPDDVMQPVPFAAIDLDDRLQAYSPLIAQFEVVRARSLSGYYESRPALSNTAARSGDIVVFADPVLGTQSPERVQPRVVTSALPSSRTEAESIARIFTTRVITYAGADATSDVLLSPEVRAAKVLHIATHGYFSKTTPDVVGLVTSSRRGEGRPDDGFLGFTELFSAPFSARLVIISGCETLRGKDYTGWGVRSLADGFISQGAGSVIGTLWSVSDAATAALMDEFYRNLQRGAGSSTALQVAQRELIASSRFADPYYWAGVALASSNRGFDRHAL